MTKLSNKTTNKYSQNIDETNNNRFSVCSQCDNNKDRISSTVEIMKYCQNNETKEQMKFCQHKQNHRILLKYEIT